MSKEKTRARREHVERIRAEQRRRDRRRALVIWSTVVVVVGVMVGLTAFTIMRQGDQAKAPIAGLQEIKQGSANHVQGAVNYPQSPPIGGDHNEVWQNCGVYNAPIQNENAVHSLEHGAVWVTYQPTVPLNEVEALTAKMRGKPFTLVSPYEGQKSKIVLSAWGLQLGLDGADDPRFDAFLKKYTRGPQTPEPGAPCTGGTGDPTA